MSRRSRGGRRRKASVPKRAARTRQPKSGFREYLERCEAAGRVPEDFMTYLEHARRWRTEYDAARERGDVTLVRELEDLLCERRSAGRPARPITTVPRPRRRSP